ncbi:hypothetical protein C0W54_12825 [Photobacterium kishitanii]|uniref:DUF3289 family protein n=1 Tax=Photobacterium kishitanii TaxID=318456 RepID=UPI000D17BB46|nr:DUF3289 family protein [Photobacterium kishitanii]PSW61155.1 hypothetical protein C0W54_12825 [Photobacterium kishitanii]
MIKSNVILCLKIDRVLIYAVSITISSLTINNGSFDGVLSFKVQDHFGLDKADVSTEKPFHTLAFFREWFLLQRYEKFGFKPFITEMNFDTDIKGVY